MSIYSGKYDFADYVDGHGIEAVKEAKIYVGFDYDEKSMEIIPKKELKIESIRDCIPYYPHIIAVQLGREGRDVLYLTEKSYIDIQEECGRFSKETIDYYRNELAREMAKFEN